MTKINAFVLASELSVLRNTAQDNYDGYLRWMAMPEITKKLAKSSSDDAKAIQAMADRKKSYIDKIDSLILSVQNFIRITNEHTVAADMPFDVMVELGSTIKQLMHIGYIIRSACNKLAKEILDHIKKHGEAKDLAYNSAEAKAQRKLHAERKPWLDQHKAFEAILSCINVYFTSCGMTSISTDKFPVFISVKQDTEESETTI